MNTQNPPFVFFEDVTFHYTDVPILDKVRLFLNKQEFCLLIGPNGGGKTTLVKLLLGLLKPSAGSVLINGQAPWFFREKIGYVPQFLHFDPQFPITVGEFVMLGALSKLKWYGKWPKEVKETALNLLDEVQLSEYFHRPFGSLSGGQRQRATLMRSLMTDPELLILDEPINNLDAKSSDFFYKIVQQSRKNRTIIMITHFLGTLFEEADSIYVVNGTVHPIDKESACSHYPIGLYHLPGGGS